VGTFLAMAPESILGDARKSAAQNLTRAFICTLPAVDFLIANPGNVIVCSGIARAHPLLRLVPWRKQSVGHLPS
jgi:hypothetical protein